MELIGERMTHLVKADEEHVADDEIGRVAGILPRSFDRRLVIGSRALMLSHGNGAGDVLRIIARAERVFMNMAKCPCCCSHHVTICENRNREVTFGNMFSTIRRP
jgi:hypothetical protein